MKSVHPTITKEKNRNAKWRLDPHFSNTKDYPYLSDHLDFYIWNHVVTVIRPHLKSNQLPESGISLEV